MRNSYRLLPNGRKCRSWTAISIPKIDVLPLHYILDIAEPVTVKSLDSALVDLEWFESLTLWSKARCSTY